MMLLPLTSVPVAPAPAVDVRFMMTPWCTLRILLLRIWLLMPVTLIAWPLLLTQAVLSQVAAMLSGA